MLESNYGFREERLILRCATNKNRLKSVFEEIDKLEKTKIEVLSYEQRAEEFKPFLWAALVLLLLELLLRLSVFKTLP